MRAQIANAAQIALSDQDNARQDDGLERENQVQQVERRHIEREAGGVDDQPARKQREMAHNERRTARHAGRQIAESTDVFALLEHPSLEFGNGLYVLYDRRL